LIQEGKERKLKAGAVRESNIWKLYDNSLIIL